jgi:hypothetical protein
VLPLHSERNDAEKAPLAAPKVAHFQAVEWLEKSDISDPVVGLFPNVSEALRQFWIAAIPPVDTSFFSGSIGRSIK